MIPSFRLIRRNLLILASCCLPLAASAQIVTNNLVIEYATDLTDDNIWETTVNNSGAADAAINRLANGGNPVPVLNTRDGNSNEVFETWYTLDPANGANRLVFSAAGASDSFQDVLGNPFTQRSVGIEMWIRQSGGINPAGQILFEDGGNGTGASITLVGGTLEFRVRSGGYREVTTDITDLLNSGNWVQVFGIISVASNELILYVNGAERTRTSTTAFTDWAGTDGGSFGGRLGGSLGGNNEGTWDIAGVSYNSFDGDLAVARIYQQLGGGNAIPSSTDVLQNYNSTLFDVAVFDNDAGNQLWNQGTNWVSNLVPGSNDLAQVSGFNAIVDSGVPDIAALQIGPDGNGTVTLNTGADLAITGELDLGPLANTGNITQNDGSLTVGGNMVFGRSGGVAAGGGIYNLRGGNLQVMGDIFQADPNVPSAQIYIDGGTLTTDGDLNFRSFRLGNAAGRSGGYTIEGGQHLSNDGSLFIGNSGNGTLNVNNGRLTLGTGFGNNDLRLAALAGSTGVLNIGTNGLGQAQVDITAARILDIGLVGDGEMNLASGTVNAGIVRLGNNNGGSGRLNMSGGALNIAGNLTTGASAAQSLVELQGGAIRFTGNPTQIAVNDLVLSGGSIHFAAGTINNNAPWTANDSLDISGPITVDLDPPTPTGAANLNTVDEWVGGTGVWDNDRSMWMTPDGAALLPSEAAGGTGVGASYPILTSAAGPIDGAPAANVSTTNAAWSVDTSDANTVALTYAGSTISGGPARAIIGAGDDVTRHTDLSIATAPGKDAAQLQIDDGSLTLSTTAELVLGTGGNQGGNVEQNGGRVILGSHLRFGDNPDGGGDGGYYRLRGGSLTVAGDIVESFDNVDQAQFYLDGGALNVAGDIRVQSFRVGHTVDTRGSYTIDNGQRIENTGSFFVGANGTGEVVVRDGTIVSANNLVMGSLASSTNDTNRLTLDHPNALVDVYTTNQGAPETGLQIGNNGIGEVIVNDGHLVAHDWLTFGRLGGSGSLDINGGRVTLESDIVTPLIAQGATINLNAGALELVGDAANRFVHSLNMGATGSPTLVFGVAASGVTPLNINSNATITAGEVDLVSADASATSTAIGDAVTWIGGAANWDNDATRWETAGGANLLPAAATGFVPTGVVHTILSGPNLVGTNNLTPASPGIELLALNSSNLAARAITDGIGGVPVLAVITGAMDAVTRSDLLQIAPEPGRDAAGLVVSNGTLSLAQDLEIGGSQNGVVRQEGGEVNIAGDLRFGPGLGGPAGGYYVLNGGTLNVTGDMDESIGAVTEAHVYLNGGSLNVGGKINLQRLSIAENGIASNRYTVANPIFTSGTLAIGAFEDAVGTMIMPTNSPRVSASTFRVGQGENGTGTLLIEGGELVARAGLSFAGDAQTDTNTTSTVVIGRADLAGDGPTIDVVTGNGEWGIGGHSTITMYEGVYTQRANNIVISQGVGATNIVDLFGGTVGIHAAGSLNFNRGYGRFTMHGGELIVGLDVALGNNAASDNVFTLHGGTVRVGRNLAFRNNGTDTFNLSGGTLMFADTGAGIIDADTTGNNTFTFTGGLLENCKQFQGSLTQSGGTNMIGAPLGRMTVTADFTGSAAATLQLDIDWDGSAPITAGSHFDQLQVNDVLDLGGMNLNLTLHNFTPPAGETRIPIVDGYSSLTGEFAQGGSITADGETFAIEYGVSSVDLVYGTDIDPELDSDTDGIVDVLEQAFGTDENSAASGAEGLPVIERVDASTVRVLWRQQDAPSAFNYGIISTDDLQTPTSNWLTESPVANPAANPPNGAPAGFTWMEALFPSSADFLRYYRVSVGY